MSSLENNYAHSNIMNSLNGTDTPLPTTINLSVRDGVFLTVQFEDHSKLRFPSSVILPFTNVHAFLSAETVNITFINNLC